MNAQDNIGSCSTSWVPDNTVLKYVNLTRDTGSYVGLKPLGPSQLHVYSSCLRRTTMGRFSLFRSGSRPASTSCLLSCL